MTNPHILIGTDEDSVRSAIVVLLSTLECSVHEARSKTEFRSTLESLAQEGLSLDLVILDIDFDGLSGLRTLRDLRGEGYEMPVILISSYDSLDRIERLGNKKDLHILTKPFNPGQFDEIVKRNLAPVGSPR